MTEPSEALSLLRQLDREPNGLRRAFRLALDALDDDLASAATEVSRLLPAVSDGLLSGRVDGVETARRMTLRLQDRCGRLEHEGFVLLAREAPVGRDLRRLVALVRLASDLDRAASLVRHLAEASERVRVASLPQDVCDQLARFTTAADTVLTEGVAAWRAKDGLAIVDVDRLDEVVDELQVELLASAVRFDLPSETTLMLGLIARYVERIADHGVAFARDAAFVVTGDRVVG